MSYFYSFGDSLAPRKPRPPQPKFIGHGLAKCNRCGAESLRWAESKTGKKYLSESFEVYKYGRTFTNYRPHFPTCAQNQVEDALVVRNGEGEGRSWADDVANGRTDDALLNYEMQQEMGVYGSDSDYSSNEDL
jgi:hypothetical protein